VLVLVFEVLWQVATLQARFVASAFHPSPSHHRHR
jgi:hypothetical protein